MTMGLKSMPIYIGATNNTLCVTKDPLITYALFACVYGDKTNSDVNHKQQENTSTLQI